MFYGVADILNKESIIVNTDKSLAKEKQPDCACYG